MTLIKRNSKALYITPEHDLDEAIYDICTDMYKSGFKKFILEYRSCFRERGRDYSICFGCSESEDEYIISSKKFVPLKDVESRMKTFAAEYFHAEGGVLSSGI